MLVKDRSMRQQSSGKDRISELPDVVIHHILSFLKARDVVRSSLLSKRWRHMWACTPYLDISDGDFVSEVDNKFEHFVDTVLLFRDKSSIHTFRLNCYEYYDEHHVNRWINYAAKYNVKVLELDIASDDVQIPGYIIPWNLEALHLSLTSSVALSFPKTMSSLKRLHLDYVDMTSLKEELVSPFPALEVLELRYCHIWMVCITSTTLKRLTMDCCTPHVSTKGWISTPKLTFLYYKGFDDLADFSCDILPADLSSLISASIHIGKLSKGAIDLIRGLSNANDLEVFASWKETKSSSIKELSNLPTFHNLKNLTLGGNYISDNVQAVPYFLQHSPNLEALNLVNTEPLGSKCSGRNETPVKSNNVSFHCPRLKALNIRWSKKQQKVPEVLKLLQSRETVLEKLIVLPHDGS